MNRTLPLLLVWVLGCAAASAQNDAPVPGPGINRNPVFRDQLPPAPEPPPDPRDTVVPKPGTDDPRDSDSRPVLPPTYRDGRDAQEPVPGSTGPTNPASSAPDSTRPQ